VVAVVVAVIQQLVQVEPVDLVVVEPVDVVVKDNLELQEQQEQQI
tara:strand:- start:39 stop:173 length:135 start_codon:yes stop_codon:yes gene_type:complete